MEFFDLHAVGCTAGKPSIRTTERSVLITIPAHLAQSAGLDQHTRVKVQLGEVGKTKAVRISVAEDGAWQLTRRRNVSQVYVRQLMPQAPIAATEAAFRLCGDAIEITLPTPWDLLDPHVVVR